MPLSEIDKYIKSFPKTTQILLQEVRTYILNAAPAAEEIISYKMPAYRQNGILVYFAGYANHIGFYPGAAAIKKFGKQISGYKNAKGSVQFPLDKPLPLALITSIVKFRIKEILEKKKLKK
ncbi:MAG: DUF1801 domain-containing protein [Ferruginibacter sp.]